MKKRFLATVMALCFVMGMTPAVPAEAAVMSARNAVCDSCGKQISLSVSRDLYRGRGKEACSLKEHQSLSCQVEFDIYVNEYWFTCHPCGICLKTTEEIIRKNEVHSCISQQNL